MAAPATEIESPATYENLRDYQQTAFQFAMAHPFCALWLPMAFGKTLVVLTLLRYVRPKGHILIIAPATIARVVWAAEVRKWNIGVRTKSLVVNARGNKLTRAKRLERYQEILTDPPTMYFISSGLLADLIEHMPMVTLPDGTESRYWPFQTVIIDEVQEFKNPDSVKFKALKRMRPAIFRLIEMTGTPAPHGLMDIWSQVNLLDYGLALGDDYRKFLEYYFNAIRPYGATFTTYELKPGAEQAIYQRIAPVVMSVKNTALTLPDHVEQDVPVYLSEKEMADYKQFAIDSVLELNVPTFDEEGNELPPNITEIIANNASVLGNKLKQYASGTIYYDEQKNFHQVHTQKLEMLEYLLGNMEGNVVLTYWYKSDEKVVYEYLKKKGYNVEKFNKKQEMIDRWDRGEINILMLHPRSAGHGLNLQHGGNNMIWYTLPAGSEPYSQANYRLIRPGQTQTVYIYRLITQHTYDTRIMGTINGYIDDQQSLVDAVQQEYDHINDAWIAPRFDA